METKKIVMGVISVAVAIVVLMSMIPIFTDAGASEDTFSNVNDSMFSVTELTPETEYTFIWDSNTPTVATVNGETVDLKYATIICSTGTFLIRYGNGGSSVGYYMQSIGGNVGLYFNTVNNTGKFTITNSESGLTIVSEPTGGTTTTNSYTYDRAFGIAKIGNWVMKSPTQTVYMNGNSDVIAMGLTSLDGVWSNAFYISGNIDDGISVIQYSPSPATYSISDIENDSKRVDGYIDLYTLNKITFNATNISDSSLVTPVTYNYFIVPAEVTAERSAHASPVEATLIGLIPLLMMVGILLTAIGLFIAKYRKN